LIQKTLAFEKNTKSSLHFKLVQYGEKISKCGVLFSILIFLILGFWILYSIIVQKDYYTYREHAHSLVSHLVFCIALIVVTIPEGVKLAETLAISSSLNKLFDRNSLIRSLNALEVMARCTDICVETTGCLTNPKINVESVHLGGNEPIPIFETKKLIQHKNARKMLETIIFSSSCFYELIN